MPSFPSLLPTYPAGGTYICSPPLRVGPWESPSTFLALRQPAHLVTGSQQICQIACTQADLPARDPGATRKPACFSCSSTLGPGPQGL